MIGPFIEQLAGEYSGRLKVGKVNIDEEPELTNDHGIATVPTLLVYNEGKIINQAVGALPKPKIEALFANLLQ
jgi:thioredoxin 1